ncbi:tetratricopeptide repeat protein [Burkholderia lata]|uniref:tetratricopeptide repeat protein n=1 Tax=Burkholderia lata (strain ATCC 17760 / DSM 23089 / LMG 22485 / NCIMB 9086 / R18194 / 383) TaxID=482957 RepID=UPI00399B0F2A
MFGVSMKNRKVLYAPPARPACIADGLPLPAGATGDVEPGFRASVGALSQRTLQLLNVGHFEQSAACARQAISIDQGSGFLRLLLGVALTQGGRRREALEAFTRAAVLAPHDPQIRYNLAVALHESGQQERAMVEYRACLERDPDCANALWNYGELLRLREHFDKALECFDRLAHLEGRLRDKAAHRMAVCCAYLGLDERARALFETQIAEDNDPVTHWEYAHFLLGRGRFRDAWPHYARRFDAGKEISLKGMSFPYSIWSGQFESGSTLIVSGEQGAGDEILFAAFLPLLLKRARSANMRVVVVCRPALVRLFRESFPSASVLGGMVTQEPDLRAFAQESSRIWRIPIGDLPLWLDKPEPDAYLKPAPEDQHTARQLVAQSRSGDGCRHIGIVWSANPVSTASNRLARSVPSELLNAYLKDIGGVHFYSLMPAEHRAVLAGVPDLPVTDLSHFLTDFSRTAAAMQCLDEIVSVCTSSANLAGALGLKTHVLLQKHADWRWFGDTAWYSDVVTYRQEARADWGTCLQALSANWR